MEVIIPDSWTIFCIAFGIVLFTSYIMGRLGRLFYNRDVSLRKFSILDLQLAPNAKEIVILVKGIYKLPEAAAKKVIGALKAQLYVDFLFMPAAYGSIFILCMKLSAKMTDSIGPTFFSALAWLQLIAFLFDIIENIYLLGKVRKDPVQSSDGVFKAFRFFVACKWLFALLGVVCSLASLLYFWFADEYDTTSLKYILIIGIEVAVFVVLSMMTKKKDVKKVDLAL